MSTITSIATSLPAFCYDQNELCAFADKVYAENETDSRKLAYLYHQSGIKSRYSVLPDFGGTATAPLFDCSAETRSFAGIDERMENYHQNAATLSIDAITKCITNKIDKRSITHLITVSCTGMSAPGLDLEIIEQMSLPVQTIRTSVNFMGCYAAIHAMKMADAFCSADTDANVVVVCTELCTLHFQEAPTIDNITASLLFADGAAAMLFQTDTKEKGIRLQHFYSEVSFKGKKDMSWQISSKGFLMTLTGFVPDLIKEDFEGLVNRALEASGTTIKDIDRWCIHPGGKKILDTITTSLALKPEALRCSYDILSNYGNMSSATIVFVLQQILKELQENNNDPATIFGAAFGPGLTMETFTAVYG